MCYKLCNILYKKKKTCLFVLCMKLAKDTCDGFSQPTIYIYMKMFAFKYFFVRI